MIIQIVMGVVCHVQTKNLDVYVMNVNARNVIGIEVKKKGIILLLNQIKMDFVLYVLIKDYGGILNQNV